jgi:hypothetical protein
MVTPSMVEQCFVAEADPSLSCHIPCSGSIRAMMQRERRCRHCSGRLYRRYVERPGRLDAHVCSAPADTEQYMARSLRALVMACSEDAGPSRGIGLPRRLRARE